jgi:AcrR family transcriptional regulator
MARTADEGHRAQLLDRIVDYVLAQGFAGLSLRPLAKAVRSSPRVLLYYFGSKEELVVEVLARARERQRHQFERLQQQEITTALDACRAIWSVMSAPKAEAAFRFFFEIYSLALQDPKRYPGFLKSAVNDWLSYIERPYVSEGYSPGQARAIATVVLAGYRGFMLDLCATHDRARIDRAVDAWLRTLGALPSPKELEERHERPNAS